VPHRSSPIVHRLLAGALDLLLPRQCVACDSSLAADETGVICGACWSRLPRLAAPQCARCGHPVQSDACRLCSVLPPFVRAARSVCWVPHPVASAVVHALKYHEWTAAADGMARRMARLAWPADVVEERAALVPVPLARARERERGFNQSLLLAQALGTHWQTCVWSDVLIRHRATSTQTRLTPTQRSANVLHAFSVPDAARRRVRGMHLVLVDDVLTTGATMNACAHALFDAGARIISYVTFGRAKTSLD
jgi:ComF family protein